MALFIIVIGGFLGVTMKTGAIQAGINRLVTRLKGRERLMIPILMTVFAIGGYDLRDGGGEPGLLRLSHHGADRGRLRRPDRGGRRAPRLRHRGARARRSTRSRRASHPGSPGSRSATASLGRIVILVVGLAIGIFFVLRYADRVKKDPTKSVVYDMKAENEAHFTATEEGGDGGGAVVVMTRKQKLILVVFGLAFGVMMYGVIPWEDLGIGLPTLWWWFPEMTASFLFFAILIGLIGRMKESKLTETFVDGARDLLGVALIIGIARGITVIMNNGEITDTVLHWAEVALGDVGKAAFSVVMCALFLPLSFLIPSSSGLATVAMPIMAPLAGFVDVPSKLVVTAYQSANGLMNLFIPTSAVVMGGLAIARVPYGRYLQVGVAAPGRPGGADGGRARRRLGGGLT